MDETSFGPAKKIGLQMLLHVPRTEEQQRLGDGMKGKVEEHSKRAQRAANSRQDSAASVDDEATSSVVANRVRGVLDILPDDQRIAIQIAYFGGKTYREVRAQKKAQKPAQMDAAAEE